MSKRKNSEKPEVYALSQDGGAWRISRRDFLKAAGIGAAALGTGSNSRFIRPAYAGENMPPLCRDASSHKSEIADLLASADGRYLVTMDKKIVLKCWDFETFDLIGTYTVTGENLPDLYAGYRDGKPGLFFTQESYTDLKIGYFSLPEMRRKETEERLSFDESENVIGIAVGTDESIYAASDRQKIYRSGTNEDGKGDKVFRTLNVSENGRKYVLCGGQMFAVWFESGDFGTIDLSDGTIRKFETPKIRDFAVLPGGAAAILIDDSNDVSYRLVSMIDGKTVWEKSLSKSGTDDDGLYGAAVTPDGSMAVLAGHKNIRLVSAADGSLIGSFEADAVGSAMIGKAAVSGDGSKMAAAAGRTVLFFSLPDLNVIGCPMDDYSEQGIAKVSGTDPDTGQTVNYTLPCGTAIPAGVVCTCNCVAPSCTHDFCITYSPPCRCDAQNHYWHPN